MGSGGPTSVGLVWGIPEDSSAGRCSVEDLPAGLLSVKSGVRTFTTEWRI